MDANSLDSELGMAMGEAMGCGGHVSGDHGSTSVGNCCSHPIPPPKPYEFIGFGRGTFTTPYKFTGFVKAPHTKPYEFIGFGGGYLPKPYKFIGFGEVPLPNPMNS